MIDKGSLPCDSVEFASLSKELLHAGKTLRFTARGSSMAPLIRDGDRLVVKPVKESIFYVGDVVLFEVETERLALHRVIEVFETSTAHSYLLQGDQVNHVDGTFDQEKILGRLVSLERNGKIIQLHEFGMKMLSRLVVGQSRGNFKGTDFQKKTVRILRKIPYIKKYLI